MLDLFTEITKPGSKADKLIIDEILISAKENLLHSAVLLGEITDEDAILQMEKFMRELGY